MVQRVNGSIEYTVDAGKASGGGLLSLCRVSALVGGASTCRFDTANVRGAVDPRDSQGSVTNVATCFIEPDLVVFGLSLRIGAAGRLYGDHAFHAWMERADVLVSPGLGERDAVT